MGEAAESLVTPEPGKVAIRDLDGTVSLIKQGDLQAAQGEGARPASETEYFGAKHGAGGQVAAGLVGAARGASFGLSDPLYVEGARALAGDQSAEGVRNTIRLLKAAHPDANLGGEVAGTIAPLLAGGGGAANTGASLVERGLGVTAADAGFFGRAGIRALEAAPRAIGEGAAIGMGAQLSDDTIENHKLAAENYATAAFKGGTVGLLLGTAGAAGVGAIADKTAQLRGLAGGHGATAIEERFGTKAATEGVEDLAAKETTRGPVGKWLDDASDIQAFKGTTNAKTGDIRRLGIDVEAQEGTEARLGKMLKDENLTGPLVTQAESAKRISTKMTEVGKSIRPLYEELDKAAQRPSMSAIATRFNEEVRVPHASMLYGDVELRPAEDLMRRLQSKGGQVDELATQSPSFTDLWKARQEIDGQLKKAYSRIPGSPVPPGEEAMRSLRSIVDDELQAAAGRAGKELGTNVADRLKLANATYRDLATVNKIATHQASLNAASNMVSITDVIGASTGGLAGVAMGAANMVRRKFGNQIASHVLEKAARMQGVQNAVTKMDDLLSKGTRSFMEGTGGKVRPPRQITAAEVREVRDAVSNPSAVQARVAAGMGDLNTHAPQVASAMALNAARTATWLSMMLPKEPPPMGLGFKPRPPRPLSDTELSKSRNIIETAEDPSIVVDRLREGRLTIDHVKTLKATSPETFVRIQKYIRDHGAELRPTLSQQQEVALSLLFEQPLNESMLPANIKAFQATFTQGSQGPGKGAPAGPKMSAGPIKGGGSSATATDKAEAGL